MYDVDISFIKKINNGYGARSQKETTLYELRNIISQTHMVTIDYQGNTLVDGTPVPLIVMEYHGNSIDRERIKKIEAPAGSVFYLGSKIDCFGLKWLVTAINYNQEIRVTGRMQLCNYVLKWQDDENTIIKEDCIVKRFYSTSTGENEHRIITTNDTHRNILIQMNPNVLKLTKGRRLFADFDGIPNPKVYEITNIDRISHIYGGRGLVEFTLTEREKTDNDNSELMIADFREPELPAGKAVGFCEITYRGKPLLKAGGSAKKFIAAFKDKSGKLITTIMPEWELIVPSKLKGQIEITSQTGCEIKLRAKSVSTSTGSVFVLKLTANDEKHGCFECKVDVEIGGMI